MNDELIRKYYSQLNINQINELLKIYINDFKIFGYSYDKYLSIMEKQIEI